MAIKAGGRLAIGVVITAVVISGIMFARKTGMFDQFTKETPPPAAVVATPVEPTPAPVAAPREELRQAEQPKLVEPTQSNDAGLARLLEQGKK